MKSWAGNIGQKATRLAFHGRPIRYNFDEGSPCNSHVRNVERVTFAFHNDRNSGNTRRLCWESTPCGAADAARAGIPAYGRQARGNMRAARAAIARNWPLGASNIITLGAGSSCCFDWAPRRIAAPPAAV